MKSRSNAEWVEVLSQQGTAAQHDLFLELGRYLHRIVCDYVGWRSASLPGLATLSQTEQEELAHDFVQQALILIHQQLPQYRGEGAFLSWAATIAIRKAGEELRKAHWRTVRYDPTANGWDDADWRVEWSVMSLPDPGHSPDDRVLMQEVWQVINRTIEEDLSGQQRQAFVARFIEERTHREIADMEGVTASVIYQRIHQARLKIKRRLLAAGYEI